jgi:hypothetical protein
MGNIACEVAQHLDGIVALILYQVLGLTDVAWPWKVRLVNVLRLRDIMLKFRLELHAHSLNTTSESLPFTNIC